MSMLSMQIEGLREAANCLDEIGISIGHDTTASAFIAHDVSERMRSAAYTIESLGQKIEDLEGMLGELPPEGKCAMLLVKQVDGKYVWGCERYDFASYCLVDSESDTYTGMTLNDPYDRADSADKLTMAKELRKMAASLDAQGDILGILTGSDAFGQKLSESRYSELFGAPERAARVIVALNHCRVVCCEECAARGACRYDGCGDDYDALLEWLRGDA